MFSDENLPRQDKALSRMYNVHVLQSTLLIRSVIHFFDQSRKYPKIKFCHLEKYLLII
jgi:hypothetical protein